jgi:hypothetical protein
MTIPLWLAALLLLLTFRAGWHWRGRSEQRWRSAWWRLLAEFRGDRS